MSTKPTTLYIWDANGANMIAPSSGLLANGYPAPSAGVGAKPTSSELNGLLNNVTQAWLKYLQDGDLELSGIEFDPTTYTFSTTSVNNLDVSGVGSLSKVGYVLLKTSTSGPYTVTGLSGSSPGKVLVLQNRTADPITLSNLSGSSLAANRCSFPGAVAVTIAPLGIAVLIGAQSSDASSFGWLLLAATGGTTQTLGVGPFGWEVTTGTPTLTVGGGDVPYISASSAWAVLLPIAGIPPGSTVSEVVVYYDRNGGNVTGGSLNYRDPSDTTSHTVLGNVPADSSSSGLQSLSMAGVSGSLLPFAFTGAAPLHLTFTVGSLSKLYGVKVTYTR